MPALIGGGDIVATAMNDQYELVHAQYLTDSLTAMFGELLGERVVEIRRVEANAQPPRNAPVLVEIEYVWFLTPTVYLVEDSNDAYYGLGLDWTFTVTYPQTPSLRPDVFRDTSLPGAETLKTTRGEFRQSPETRIAFRGAQVRRGGKTKTVEVQKSESELYGEIEMATLTDFVRQVERIAGLAPKP